MSYTPDCADCPTPDECKAKADCQVLRQIRHRCEYLESDKAGLVARYVEMQQLRDAALARAVSAENELATTQATAKLVSHANNELRVQLSEARAEIQKICQQQADADAARVPPEVVQRDKDDAERFRWLDAHMHALDDYPARWQIVFNTLWKQDSLAAYIDYARSMNKDGT